MNDVAQLEKKMEARFDELMVTLSGFADGVHKRFDEHDKRFDEHDRRFDEHDKRFDKHDAQFRILNDKYDQLLNTMDGFLKKLEEVTVESAARDHKVERLERWIQQIADQTGVKLSVS